MLHISDILKDKYQEYLYGYKGFLVMPLYSFDSLYHIFSKDGRMLYQGNFKTREEARHFIDLYSDKLNDLKSY